MYIRLYNLFWYFVFTECDVTNIKLVEKTLKSFNKTHVNMY